MKNKRKRNLSAEDLYNMKALASCEISPNGDSVIFSVNRIEKKTEEKYSNIWISDVRTSRSHQFTHGDHVDILPVWSPDGKYIAFLSNRKDENQFQIFIIPFRGGESRPVTQLKGQFGGIAWSPDSRKLLFQFQKTDKKIIDMEKNEDSKKLGIVDRQVKRVFFKEDGAGYNSEERWHIWTTGIKSLKSKQLTKDNRFDEGFPVWSPDGKTIAFISNRTEEPDLLPFEDAIFTIPSSGGEVSPVPVPKGMKMFLSYSPDGKKLAYFGHDGVGKWWRDMNLWNVSLNGKPKAINLTEGYDFNIDSLTCADISDAELTPPVWSGDSGRIYFQVSRYGRVKLKKIVVSTSEVVDVINEEAVVGKFSIDRLENRLAYYRGDVSDPTQVWVLNLRTQTRRQLTYLNKKMFSQIRSCSIEEVWIKSRDKTDIQGWIIKPPGFRKEKKYPSILQVHGGPHMQYGYHYLHEFFFLASKGYVVHCCNPRGSDGYGEEFKSAIDNRIGTVDYTDVMDWVKFVSRKPYIDNKRRGVTGGSYGGFMTNWIIGKTNIFKAAVTQRSVSNNISFWGSSDFNWSFQCEFGDKSPWEDHESYWRQSPMKYMKNVKTPTLVIHSEHDYRCDIEQGEQIFVALKVLGVDTEMIRFPDESHGLSRIGRTDRRISRLNHILRWFDKYLKKPGS